MYAFISIACGEYNAHSEFHRDTRCINFWLIYSTDGREYVKSTLSIGGPTDHGFALHIYFLFDGTFGDRKITDDCQFRVHDDVVQFTVEISSAHSTNYSVFACAL